MTYEKIFADVKKVYSKADKSKLEGDFAFQFNISGEGEGSFYVAFRGGILEIAPYDYVDRSALLTASGENFIKLANAKFTLEDAVAGGLVEVQGDYHFALELNKLASTAVQKDSVKKPKKETVSRTSAVKKSAVPIKKAVAKTKPLASPGSPVLTQDSAAVNAVKIIPEDKKLV
ncbi:MAG: SCP2 sterol-binding domain-containing protein [Oscillospiraceae bacterium]|nr:SCP2 sterol-binding domain-containing protein [Oscillospiraceae bacterium]